MVDAAARARVSAVKLQTLDAHLLVAPSCPAPMHVEAASLADFFSRFELDVDAHRLVAARAHQHGLAFLSTPFHEGAVRLLCEVGCDALKIASGDLTHLRLIETAATTGLPLIISTGLSSIDEVALALACARDSGARDVALLHCVSAYPTPRDSANLAAIATLAARLQVPVGLSDHGADALAPALTLALGGSIYERHFVARFEDDAVDRAVSSCAEEFADIVSLAARVQALLGHGRKECLPAEAGNLTASRRGVYACRDLAAGTLLGEADLQMLRPLSEVPAQRWRELLGRRLREPVAAGAAIPATALEPPIGEPTS
jgi:sialic acid synthase SpsE